MRETPNTNDYGYLGLCLSDDVKNNFTVKGTEAVISLLQKVRRMWRRRSEEQDSSYIPQRHEDVLGAIDEEEAWLKFAKELDRLQEAINALDPPNGPLDPLKLVKHATMVKSDV